MPENVEISQNDLEKQRQKKLEAIKEKGIDPYPNRFQRRDTIQNIRLTYFSHETEVPEGLVSSAGRVIAKRDMGKAVFVEFQDESGQLQIYTNNKLLNETDYFVLQNLDLGDIIGVTGKPFRTKTNEPSVQANTLTLLAKNLSPLPVVKEKDGEVFDAFADIETRYRKRYTDLAVNRQTRNDFFLRSQIVSETRKFLTSRGFMEVETPMLQSIASGAAARPFSTHHNTLNMGLFMRIAPELYLKRLIVGGFEKVFELNRNFRNEGISTKHNPEFTMMEIYEAYGDFHSMMSLTEDIFEHIALNTHGKTDIPYGETIISLKKPWKRIAYLESILEKTGLDFRPYLQEKEPAFESGKSLAEKAGIDVKGLHTFWEVVDAAFSQKVEPFLIQPVFITDYPKAISPLAKNIPGNPHLVERFEPYITGREMGNAFTELNDPQEQYARFADQIRQHEQGAEETIPLDDDFIEALRVGMPPTGGLGIGIDRMVMLFTNKSSIKDVILFPLLRPKE